ncbi:unnamed protein product [Cladocopium goreaui]|uniref:Leucine-rich repeat protein lrrA n=1 Tax=Cladocopium goreaui TaxID=2562237 RepID=A0A9P1M0J3_9DINO|nr:unnamed protein product [Cladocopium goreaui]
MDFDALEEAEEQLEDADSELETAFLQAVGVKDVKDLHDRETIELCGAKLTGLPCLKLQKLRRLQVKRCDLQQLPSSLGRMCNLRHLNLAENRLEGLPEQLVMLESLEELDLADNRLLQLPDDMKRLENLQQLNVRKNLLSRLPSLGDSLLEVDASQNRLDTFPDLGPRSQLRTLWLGGNQIPELPETVNCRSLVGLQLAQNMLQVLPKSLGTLRQLQHLDLSENCLMTLPKEIFEQLKQLCSLDLTSNRICGLEPLGVLPDLRKLAASDNAIERLPDDFDEFLALRTLELVGNPVVAKMQLSKQHPAWLGLYLLQSVGSLRECHLVDDESLKELPAMVDGGRLCLQGQGLRSLPRSICLVNLVQQLDVSSNRLTELPAALGKLPLRELCVANNQLRELPSSFSDLTQLQQIDASNNQLQQLPEDLTPLGENLVNIQLAQNRLLKLPDSFCSLARLRRADLTQNRLVTLPRNIGKLLQLEWLGLGRSDLVELPRSFRRLQRLTQLHLAGTPLASTLLQVEDLPEQRILWEMNQWGKLAVINIHAQQQGKIPETLVKWRWATLPPARDGNADVHQSQSGYETKKPKAREKVQASEGLVADVAEVVQALRHRLDETERGQMQQLMRHLFREWHPDKRHDDEKVLATRVFQWLQEVKVHYLH